MELNAIAWGVAVWMLCGGLLAVFLGMMGARWWRKDERLRKENTHERQ
jgi:hypothetical protein